MGLQFSLAAKAIENRQTIFNLSSEIWNICVTSVLHRIQRWHVTFIALAILRMEVTHLFFSASLLLLLTVFFKVFVLTDIFHILGDLVLTPNPVSSPILLRKERKLQARCLTGNQRV